MAVSCCIIFIWFIIDMTDPNQPAIRGEFVPVDTGRERTEGVRPLVMAVGGSKFISYRWC